MQLYVNPLIVGFNKLISRVLHNIIIIIMIIAEPRTASINAMYTKSLKSYT